MHLYFGDKVGLEVAQSVLVDAAFVVPADFGIDAANGQVHPAQAPLCVPVHVLARIDIAGPSITEIEDARQQGILKGVVGVAPRSGRVLAGRDHRREGGEAAQSVVHGIFHGTSRFIH